MGLKMNVKRTKTGRQIVIEKETAEGGVHVFRRNSKPS